MYVCMAVYLYALLYVLHNFAAGDKLLFPTKYIKCNFKSLQYFYLHMYCTYIYISIYIDI